VNNTVAGTHYGCNVINIHVLVTLQISLNERYMVCSSLSIKCIRLCVLRQNFCCVLLYGIMYRYECLKNVIEAVKIALKTFKFY
jgi:hypothetical protein